MESTYTKEYEVKYVLGEWWTTFATCSSREYADRIEQMLLADGKTTRIDAIRQGVILGTPKQQS
jgi:hypothetical protein